MSRMMFREDIDFFCDVIVYRRLRKFLITGLLGNVVQEFYIHPTLHIQFVATLHSHCYLLHQLRKS